jgi:hypothetical protein
VPIEKEYSFGTDQGPQDAARAFRRALAAARLSLHVQPVVYGGLPGLLVGGRHLQRRGAPPERPRRDVHLHLAGAAGQAAGVQAADGWSFPWASSHGSDYNFDLEVSRPQEATRELLAGGVPAVAAQLTQECGTEPVAYLSGAPVLSAYALEDRTRLPDLFHHRGLEFMMGYYGFLDRAPLGRDEGDPPQM